MKRLVAFLLLIFGVICFIIPVKSSLYAQDKKLIYIIPVKGTIDLGLSAFITRAVNQAKNEQAAAIILKIDTFGGRVDAADEIVNSLAEVSDIPTYAYIEHSAWSAGALVALACKEIIMNKGSSIGSAEPRVIGVAPGTESTDEKIISALRAKFKSTAEANNHSAGIAEAMVDKDLLLFQVRVKDEVLILISDELKEKQQEYHVKSFRNKNVVCAKGKLLNLTAIEAKNLNFSKLTVYTEDQLFDYVEKETGVDLFTPAKIINLSPNWSENLVRALTHPIFSSLLLSLGFLGLLFELKMPGWGISGTLGVLFIILFFWGHYLVGLANWTDLLIFGIGLLLLVFEIVALPGFGLLGFSGIITIFIGLALALLKHPLDFPSFEFSNALSTLAWTFIITFILGILGLNFLPKTGLFRKIVLETREIKALGFRTKPLPKNIVVGKIGLSKTILRPSGKAIFNDKVLDVTTLGEFIAADKQVVIVKIEGSKIFVEQRRNV